MRKDWKYILYIALAFGAFILLKLLSPRQHDWTVTYSAKDKNPYGGYALNSLLATNFFKNNIIHSFQTLYELKDTLSSAKNIFIVSSTFNAGKEDTRVLLDHIGQGSTALISAEYFYGQLADTLHLEAYDNLFKSGEIYSRSDSGSLRFSSTRMDTALGYNFRRDNIHNYFKNFDTTRTTVIAKNDRNEPVTIRVRWGKGSFILNSTPMMFTNIYLLAKDNNEFVSSTLSFLPDERVVWTEYYHLGRMEIQTPLRFILITEPLRWAYYITVISILIFMVFEYKRKQRIIPVIKPLANTTLEFVSTIGDLYFQKGQHKNIAEKKINYLLDQIRTKYLLNTNKLDEAFIDSLSRKSGKDVIDIRNLVRLIVTIRSSESIQQEILIDLNSNIEKFSS